MPVLPQRKAAALVKKRHIEWVEFQRTWRWLADSLEGGVRYQRSDYSLDPIEVALGINPTKAQLWPFSYPYPDRGQGVDFLNNEPYGPSYGLITQRNLVPHLSETGPDGRDLYTLRLTRTPVPDHLPRAIGQHLAKILSKEVRRVGPDAAEEWWEDVDGKGTSVKEWVEETAGPLFLALGQLDLLCDRPQAPEGATIQTRADELSLNLDRALVSVVLPENLPWWELDYDGRHYVEAVVFDRYGYRIDGKETGPLFFHWSAEDVVCYKSSGVNVPELTREHPYGRVPIVRVFDRRIPRCKHVGQSRYQLVAAAQKAIYNLESERYLSDVQQSHALLQGPEDFVQSQNPVPIGPGNVLPMKKDASRGGYTPWAFIDPPKGAQEAIRQHVIDNADAADRAAALAKPAGMTLGATVSQSGISKIADQTDGNQFLAAVAGRLERLETEAVRLAMAVMGVADECEVTYPRQFDLDTVADVSAVLDDLQRGCQMFGALPQAEGELLKRLIALGLPGVSPERLEELMNEVDAYVARYPESGEPTPLHPETGEPLPRDADPADVTGEGGLNERNPQGEPQNAPRGAM